MAKVELPANVVDALNWWESVPHIYDKTKEKRREILLTEITKMYHGFLNADFNTFPIGEYIEDDPGRFAEVVHALSVGWVKQRSTEDKLGDLLADTRFSHNMAPARCWGSRSKSYYEGKYAGIREAAKVAGIKIKHGSDRDV